MTEIYLDSMLGRFVPNRRLRSTATTVGGLIDDLETRYPQLRNRLRDETRGIRPFVKVFVNGEEIPHSDGAALPLKPRDEVEIMHSIQGG
jgi:molybdopterin synthase sulfur carrier subunit